MSVTLRDSGGLAERFKKAPAAVKKAVTRATTRVALLIANDIKTSIQKGPKTGNQRGDGSFASAPGEAPAADTGNLVSSVSVVAAGTGSMVSTVVVRAKYARWLEFGTDPDRKNAIEPRPFVIPAADAHRKDLVPILRDELVKVKDGGA